MRLGGMLICEGRDPFQVHFAVDYSSARWRWHLGGGVLTERIHLKAQPSAEAAE